MGRRKWETVHIFKENSTIFLLAKSRRKFLNNFSCNIYNAFSNIFSLHLWLIFFSDRPMAGISEKDIAKVYSKA